MTECDCNNVKTIPWVDALHKMGRQIAIYLNIAVVFGSMCMGHTVTPEEVAVLCGGNMAYQFIKGKGK